MASLGTSYRTCNRSYGKSRYVIFVMTHDLFYNFKLFQMQHIVNPNTIPGYLNQGFKSSKSLTGLRQMMCCLKCDKSGLEPFCFSRPYILSNGKDNREFLIWK